MKKSVPRIRENVTLDLSGFFNTSLTEIHKQEFRSPRPENYSIGMRLNGRYAWEWNHYGHNALRLEDTLLRNCGSSFTTPSGIPFATPAEGANSVTVSLWDNFPTKVEIPLQGEGEELALLICGTTHAMQSYVENGRFTITYEDGTQTSVSLIPPKNFDDLLLCAYQKENETVYLSEGTHALVQKIALMRGKKLKLLTMEAVANEVIINLLAATLRK